MVTKKKWSDNCIHEWKNKEADSDIIIQFGDVMEKGVMEQLHPFQSLGMCVEKASCRWNP